MTHSATPRVPLLFLPHFDVICDLLLNRRTATWNLFVKWKRRKYILKYGKGGTIVQQSLFEFFLYIAVTIFSFYFVNFNIALVLFWPDSFRIIKEMGNEKDLDSHVQSKENMAMVRGKGSGKGISRTQAQCGYARAG